MVSQSGHNVPLVIGFYEDERKGKQYRPRDVEHEMLCNSSLTRVRR